MPHVGYNDLVSLRMRPRRSGGRKTRVAKRGAPVVRRTLEATLDELARVGYAALRVEDVAQRAKVNKTTIYRRWPTKQALVRATVVACTERSGGLVVPDTGTLHGDLTELVQHKMRFARSAEGSAIIRVLDEGSCDADVIAIVRSPRSTRDVILRTILERARARGALRKQVDVSLFMDVMQLACDQARRRSNKADPHFVKGLIDLLLQGAAMSNSKLRSKRS
jgi:AcrR family transcriptional regulator